MSKVQILTDKVVKLTSLIEIASLMKFGLYLDSEKMGDELYAVTMKKGEPLKLELPDYDEKVKITNDLMKSMEECHENKIIHMDIKPENVILVEGQYRLIDFEDAILTKTSFGSKLCYSFTYTAAFAHPEVIEYFINGCNGFEIQTKYDRYALALTLMCVWTGFDINQIIYSVKSVEGYGFDRIKLPRNLHERTLELRKEHAKDYSVWVRKFVDNEYTDLIVGLLSN